MEVKSYACDRSTGIKEASHKINENYSICRCCLSFGNHQHNFGQSELEMMMENLNLFLMADPRLPQLVCSDCVTSLNVVRSFRQKVLASEEELQRTVSEKICCDNTRLLTQSDPLEITDIKVEQDFELKSSINSETGDDKAGTKSFRTVQVKIEIEPCGVTSRDIINDTIVKAETELKSQNKSDVKSKEKKQLKPRRARVATEITKSLHLVPKDGKGLRLVSMKSKDLRKNCKGLSVVPINNKELQYTSQGLQLAPISIMDLPHTSKGLHLVPISSKNLQQSSEGLRLLPINSKILSLPQTGDALQPSDVSSENENKLPPKDDKIRKKKDSNTASKKKKHDSESYKRTLSKLDEKRKFDSEFDKREYDSGTEKNYNSDDYQNKSGSDSDTPVSHTKEELDIRASMLSKLETSRHLLLKDNSKVRSNILLILEHSTIMPFRNNSQFAFKCFYCGKLYVPFKELKQHVEMEHKQVAIHIISKIVKSMQNLIVTADISSIKCKLCDEKCESIEHLIEHLCKVHDKVYYETDRKPSHGILGVNLSSDSLTCHICKQGHTFFKNLLVHMNDHYGVFVCYVCGKKFLSDRRYKNHVTSSHTNKEIKCKECNKVFRTEPGMKYHIKKVHLKTRVKCLYCPETFTSGNYMKRLNHMAEAHGVAKPVFKCDICGKELANSGSVAHHKMYTHKQAKMNRCELCGYMTCSNTAMKNHMIVHSGEKNFECEFCKKRFAKLGTLKLHLKIHLNDKRFVCFLCNAAFIQKNSLKNHMKSRHPDAGVDITKL